MINLKLGEKTIVKKINKIHEDKEAIEGWPYPKII
jgi:hypothetical protein